MISFGSNRFIISVDDFGKNKTVNQRILDLVEKRKVDRVSVMTERGISKEDIDFLTSSSVKLDLHLDLEPKLDEYEINKKVFSRAAFFLGNYFFKSKNVVSVQRSWDKQVSQFIKMFGFVPAGINSHEFVHFFPPYFKITCRLAEKYGIDYIRFGAKSVVKTENPISKILYYLRKTDLSYFLESEKISAGHLLSYDWTDGLEGNFLSKISFSEIETIYHPELEKEYELLKNS